jgi:tight adherence protein B
LYAGCAGSAVIGFIVAAGVSRAVTIGVAFSLFAAYAPVALLGMRRRQRRMELRELWPDVVDNLASGVRAGLSLAEALTQIGVRGPELLRGPFRDFGEDYRATGRFAECLDRLKATLADPTADRIVESVRVAREVGGTDLGRLLRSLSQFLREDARTRAELETRQGWTVNAARLGLAAPWIVLALLSLRPETVAAYDSRGGVAVLAIGAGVSLAAYRVMLRLARLPAERRVLR